MKYVYIVITTNKHFGKIEKTLQTNIAVNGLYETKLCGSNTVQRHTGHSSQCRGPGVTYPLSFSMGNNALINALKN